MHLWSRCRCITVHVCKCDPVCVLSVCLCVSVHQDIPAAIRDKAMRHKCHREAGSGIAHPGMVTVVKLKDEHFSWHGKCHLILSDRHRKHSVLAGLRMKSLFESFQIKD